MLENVSEALRRPRQDCGPAVTDQPSQFSPTRLLCPGCIKRTKADGEEVVGRLKPQTFKLSHGLFPWRTKLRNVHLVMPGN